MKSRAVAVAFCGPTIAAVYAATPAPQELKRITVEAASSAGEYKPEAPSSPKYTEPLRDTPQTITVVPEQVIRDQGLLTLRDVLSTVPGITFGAGEGGGGYGDSINLRGFTGSNDISVDGVRDSAQYTRSDPFNLQQVEVVNGASSVYSGAGAVGGSINLVSKQPHLQDERLLSLAVGSEDYGRVTADSNEQLGTGQALRVNAMIHQNHAPGRDYERFKRWGLAPSVAFGLDGSTQLVVSAFHQHDDNVPQYGVPYFNGGPLTGVDPGSYYGYHNLDRQQINTASLAATLMHQFDNGMLLRNLSRWGVTTQLSTASAPQGVWCLDGGRTPANIACTPAGTFQPYTISTTAPTIGAPLTGPRGTTRDTDNRMVYSQTDLTWHLKSGGIEHTLVGGVAISHESFSLATTNPFRDTDGTAYSAADLPAFQGYFPRLDLHTPDSAYRGPLNWTLTSASSGKLDNQAIYLFDTLKYGARWQMSGGLRYEHNDGYSQAAVVSTVAPTAGQVTALAARAPNEDNILSYRAGVVFKPVEQGTLYLAYGNSKSPSRASVNGACTATATVALGTANCNLDPESAVSYELGTKWDLRDGALAVTAALFRNERQNYRVSDPGNPDNPAGEQQLDGRARTEGITFGAAGNVTRRWAMYANATLMRSEVLQGASAYVSSLGLDYTRGDPLLQVPEVAASLWSTWQLPHRWMLGYGVTYQGVTTLTQHAAANLAGPLVESEAYSVQRAMLSWQPRRKVLAQLNVNNLLDTEYYTRIRNDGWATPGDTRNFVLTINFQF